MESALLLHKRHQSLSGLRHEEGFLLGPFSGELGSPHALEVRSVGQDQLGVLTDSVFGQQVLDVVLGDTRHPLVDVVASGFWVGVEVL